jgi:hypothetical protein
MSTTEYHWTPEKIAEVRMSIRAGSMRTVYVLTTREGQRIAFLTRKTAQKYVGTIERVEINTRDLVAHKRVRIGRARAWILS